MDKGELSLLKQPLGYSNIQGIAETLVRSEDSAGLLEIMNACSPYVQQSVPALPEPPPMGQTENEGESLPAGEDEEAKGNELFSESMAEFSADANGPDPDGLSQGAEFLGFNVGG